MKNPKIPFYRLFLLILIVCPGSLFSQTIEQKNIGLLKQLIEVGYNQRNFEIVDQIVDSNYVENTNGITAKSPEVVKQTITYLAEESPNFKLVIDDVIAQGDKVALRWIYSGHNKKHDKQVIIHGMFFCTIKDGKLVESWQIFDNLTRFKQLGFNLTPPIPNEDNE